MSSLREKYKFIHDQVPLSIRIIIGPIIAYIIYILRVYILGNKNAPKVLSIDETLDHIIKNELSVIRFGDGEMSLIENTDLAFQKSDKDLSSRLEDILKLNIPNLLICIPGIFGKLDNFAKHSFYFTIHHLLNNMHKWKKVLSSTRTYGDSFITRPYLTYKEEFRIKSGPIFNKLFSIWENKDIVLVEGEKSRLGVGNNMFKNAKSLSRILCPAENAFFRYQDIKTESLKVSTDKLILISLGPTAKVLAYDIFMLGYRVIDIGHIDMEYEMYLRGQQNLTRVPYKYFNEINERDPEDCLDESYLSQIISHIK